jgi:hypothetical protein
MLAQFIGALRYLARVLQDVRLKCVVTRRDSFAFLFLPFLFLLGTLNAYSQTSYTEPNDQYFCQQLNYECVKPEKKEPYQYNFVDYPGKDMLGGGNISVPTASESISLNKYIQALTLTYGACSVSFTDSAWVTPPPPTTASSSYHAGAVCAGQPGDGFNVNFSLGLENFHIVCMTKAVVIHPDTALPLPNCAKTSNIYGYKARWSDVSCPKDFIATGGFYCWRPCQAPNAMVNGVCRRPAADFCPSTDHPISLGSGKKRLVEKIYTSNMMAMSLIYNGQGWISPTGGNYPFGYMWYSSYQRQIYLTSTATLTSATIQHENGE